jgi:hypothetical protein
MSGRRSAHWDELKTLDTICSALNPPGIELARILTPPIYYKKQFVEHKRQGYTTAKAESVEMPVRADQS